METEKKPLTRQELNEILYAYYLERQLKETRFQELYDHSKWFVKRPNHIEFDPVPRPMLLMDPEARDIPRSWNSDGIPDTEGLKVMQQNARNLGELLLDGDLSDFDAGAESTLAFRTRGYQYLLVMVVNPTWVTNPATLTMTVQYSNDAFDTVVANLVGMDAVAIAQTMSVVDAAVYCFFLQTGIQAGAVAAGNNPSCCPFPDTENTVIRLMMTPTGAGITAEDITVCVWGVNPR